MQFTTFAFAAFAALASAAAIEKRAPLCASSLDTPQCCQLSVLGVADVSCSARKPRESANVPSRANPTDTQLHSRARPRQRHSLQSLLRGQGSHRPVLPPPCGTDFSSSKESLEGFN
jgi:hypothetical protein